MEIGQVKDVIILPTMKQTFFVNVIISQALLYIIGNNCLFNDINISLKFRMRL